MSNLRDILDRSVQAILNAPRTAPSVVLFIAGLLLLSVVTLRPSTDRHDFEPLFGQSKLTSSERDRVEAALGKSELCHYRVTGGQIEVPLGRRSAYLAVIEAADCLPLSFHDPTDHAIRDSSIIESLGQKRWRREHAKERELELLLIRSVKGVEDAYVRIDETNRGGLRDEKLIAAVVGVTTSVEEPLEADDVAMIQSLIVGRNAGLKVDDVTIADLTAETVFRGDVNATATDAASQTLRRSETQWIRKVSQVLSFVPEAKVAVRVERAGANEQVHPVSVSVTLPSTYLDDLRSHKLRVGERLSLAQLESHTRTKIQAAIVPLMPQNSGDPDHLVAVNFFDVPLRELPVSMWQRPSTWVGCAAVALFAIGLGWTWRIRQEEPPTETELRVFVADEAEANESHVEVNQLQTKLRAYVEEDPDAAAKSLSEFIDRAS